MADEQKTAIETPPAQRTVTDRPDGNGHQSVAANGHAHSGSDKKYAAPSDDKAENAPEQEQKQPADSRKKTAGIVIGAIVLIFLLIWGMRYYAYSQTHVATDDAYITGDQVNISPLISGTLSQLYVSEGDSVKKGQLIAQLDDSGPAANLRQAKAAYDAALTQIPQAQITLTFQEQTTQAAIRKAQAEIAAQTAKTVGAQQQVTLSAATIKNQIGQAQSQVAQAEADAAQVQAQIAASQANVQTYRQAVQTAQRAADAAQANVAAAQAAATRATRDEARYAALVKQEAVTPQQYDTAVAAAQSAQAQLAAVQQQAAQARSQVAAARSSVVQAQAQLAAMRKQLDASRQQIEVARAGLGIAQANQSQVGIQQSNVANNLQQGGQANADLANALAGRQQIALRQKQITTYQAQALQAKAALANAQVEENDTQIHAPSDGQVVRKSASIGAALSPGQTILTMTTDDQVWVTANFKETQLNKVRVGQPAEVEVDAYPGKIFKGRVASLNEATGASTALLPPDNATGNFTKVVQRVPIRINLVPAQDNEDRQYARIEDIRRLGQGMSVTATIETGR